MESRYTQANPWCYLHGDDEQGAHAHNPFVLELVKALDIRSVSSKFGLPIGMCHFFVTIPLFSEAYSFIFTWDVDPANRHRNLTQANLSQLQQEAIFRTCSELAYALPPSPPHKPLAFICHDSRDKYNVARHLATELLNLNCPVWFDEFSLKVGDSLRHKVEMGIKQCKKCVLIISPNFLTNNGWTKKEFNAIFTRETLEEKDVILPVWYNVSVEDVYKYSPTLADKFAINWSLGKKEVARRLRKAML